MSYIKSAFIIDGIARIVEVHGATWQYLDIERYARKTAEHYRRMIPESGSFAEGMCETYRSLAEQYERYAKNPATINSGLALEIWKLGLSPISDRNKRGWARFLLKEDVPGDADDSDEPPAVLADLDVNRFYDTELNHYARYEDTLPDGWTYERVTPTRMVEILERRLSVEDRKRLF